MIKQHEVEMERRRQDYADKMEVDTQRQQDLQA
jgi:hypothetical protein